MSWEPLLSSAPAIQIHAFAAMTAFALGAVQLAAPKGTIPHRAMGWTWVALMFVVAAGSFLIHEINLWGQWSPIHILSVGTLVGLFFAVLAAKTHQVSNHRAGMIGLYVGALVIAGFFTFAPGRIMHAVVFGSP